jgi:hypothetical protein
LDQRPGTSFGVNQAKKLGLVLPRAPDQVACEGTRRLEAQKIFTPIDAGAARLKLFEDATATLTDRPSH